MRQGSQINWNLTLAFVLSKEMLVILLSSYENSSKMMDFEIS